MTPSLWRVLMIACLAAVVAAGLDWGLPSIRNDGYLFATSAWTGGQIAAMSGPREGDQAADVDRDAVAAGDVPVVLNSSDPQRSIILRRYRLYSHQPDEMITFMSLSGMNPAAGQFDPRLYQYGGLWIYPVGGLLKACGQLGWIDLRNNLAFYYDHPEAFGRFYVVARAYTLVWFVIAVACAGMITRRLTGDTFLPVIAIATVGVLPVVFALAHEAKPHLAGAALMMAAALAAERWVRTGRWRDAALAGVLVGAGPAAVLSAAVGIVILPVMAWLRDDSLSRRFSALFAALLVAAATYAALDPYVVLHLVRNDAVLHGNVANTQAMYAVGAMPAAIVDAGQRLVEAVSWPVAAVGAVALIVVVARRRAIGAMAWLVMTPALVTLIPFVLFAAGKPSEYARFAIFPSMAVGLLCVWAIGVSIARPWLRMTVAGALPVAIFIAGTLPYFNAFAEDAGDSDTRTVSAAQLQRDASPGATLQVYADPAPYCLPPIDFSNWRVVLTSPDAPPIGAAIVRPIDDPADLPPPPLGYQRQLIGTLDRNAPITWANKPFELLTRQ